MEGAKHSFKYRYTCEKCGKQTDWIKTEFQEETATNNLAEVVNSIADKNKFQKQLTAFKENVENGNYGFHFTVGASCPSCGARQSWLPAANQSTMKPAARIAIYMSLYIFLGLIFMFIIVLCKANYMLENFDDNLMLVIAFVIFPVIGLILSIRRNMINAKADKKLMESVTVRNKPEIDWNGQLETGFRVYEGEKR